MGCTASVAGGKQAADRHSEANRNKRVRYVRANVDSCTNTTPFHIQVFRHRKLRLKQHEETTLPVDAHVPQPSEQPKDDAEDDPMNTGFHFQFCADLHIEAELAAEPLAEFSLMPPTRGGSLAGSGSSVITIPAQVGFLSDPHIIPESYSDAIARPLKLQYRPKREDHTFEANGPEADSFGTMAMDDNDGLQQRRWPHGSDDDE